MPLDNHQRDYLRECMMESRQRYYDTRVTLTEKTNTAMFDLRFSERAQHAALIPKLTTDNHLPERTEVAFDISHGKRPHQIPPHKLMAWL